MRNFKLKLLLTAFSFGCKPQGHVSVFNGFYLIIYPVLIKSTSKGYTK